MVSALSGKLLPQHIRALSSSAQAWKCPAAISSKLPLGGEACPLSFCPQQAIVLLTRSAQVKSSPAEI